MKDYLIKLSDAIAALGEKPLVWVGAEYELGLQKQWQSDINALKRLPPVQPEPHWIPCSERLPEIDKEVLVTDGEIYWVCSLFESPDVEDGLYQWEDNYGHWHELDTWTAWMPLPEPYKKERKVEK